jgi:predicted Fe-S protein YdhL (DUF1289 family)
MKKELRAVHDIVSCDVCGRTILKGERTEWYLAPGGHRHKVCDLCAVRAQHHGWIRESAAGEIPTRPARNDQSRGVLGRLRRRRGEEAAPSEQETVSGAGSGGGESSDQQDADDVPAPPPRERPRSRPKDPRHVRAVPTTAEAKVDRALDLFNGSDHQNTVAGLARTLGPAWVSAQPDPTQASAVTVLVAWEISWYRYRVDLGDEADPVVMLDKGEELEQIEESLREWNAALDADGRVVAAVTDGGSEG